MKKKGFTLVELLGVIVLLSLLVMLVIPSIVGSLKKQGNKTDELMLDMIEKAASSYIEDDGSFIDKNGNSYCITISELVDKEYLKDNVEYEGKDITNSKSIQVNYSDGVNFELVDNEKCETSRIICSAVTEETKTTGNVPSGIYAAGDEYICEVKEGVYYNFFVLGEDSDSTKVNLILESNINIDGELVKDSSINDNGTVNWISEIDFYGTNGVAQDAILTSSRCTNYGFCTDTTQGPITAMHLLSNATSSWTNIEKMKMNYSDDVLGNYNSIVTEDNKTSIINKYGEEVAEYENLKARLPLVEELENTGCGYQDEGEYWQNVVAKCPLYMINYTLNTDAVLEVEKYSTKTSASLHGYWSISSTSYGAFVIRFDGRMDEMCVDCGRTMEDDSDEWEWYSMKWYGVRPVITVSKKYIKN